MAADSFLFCLYHRITVNQCEQGWFQKWLVKVSCYFGSLLIKVAVLCLVTQPCPTLPPWTVGHHLFSILLLSPGILQARILECVAMPSSRDSSQTLNIILGFCYFACYIHLGASPGPANMCTSWERSSSLGSRPWQWLLALQKILRVLLRFPWWLRESSVCLRCRRPGFDPWVGKIPWRRKWQPTPVLLPGKSHGQRSLVGYSPWGHEESDTTE